MDETTRNELKELRELYELANNQKEQPYDLKKLMYDNIDNLLI